MVPDACSGNGVCMDSVDGFYCRCYQGFTASEDRQSCVAITTPSVEKDKEFYCFAAVVSQECSRPMQTRLTFKNCCCDNRGAGWGSGLGSSCDLCPPANSAEYRTMCGKDEPVDPNVPRCRRLYPNVCENGYCVDTSALSYRCQCNAGYILNSENRCVDDNECTQLDVCEHGTCFNTEGSFTCKCYDGYALTTDGRTCTDMNECMESGMCPNGQCHNMDGAYKCICNDGYRQSPNQQICYDIDECSESRQSICANGKCENSLGSYTCICNRGYTLSPDGAFCLDYDECQQSGMCQNGQCFNMVGEYKCACNTGYRLSDDGRACIDINECQDSSEPLCKLGECINTQGSFRCSCAGGRVLDSDGTTCRETRKELCYKTVLANGRCTDPSSKSVVKSECCCSLMVGSVLADTVIQMCWGFSQELCPARGTSEYRTLCYNEKGTNSNGEDINECTMFRDVCRNGICHNLHKTGYRCMCDEGFTNPPGQETSCVDIDECATGKKCVSGTCRNTAGGYTCSCPSGYQLNRVTNNCEDVDECEQNICLDGMCRNKLGYFECTCPPHHTKLRNTTHHLCLNSRKYTCWSKYSDSGCEGNLLPHGVTRDECCSIIGEAWGSPCQSCADYTPHCSKGYYLYSGARCIDIDECQLFPNICENGYCVNTVGSFHCQCKEGLKLEGRKCVDFRKQNCYLTSKNGVCSAALSGTTKRDQCCCSVGKAWGDLCETCPHKDSAEYKALCSGTLLPDEDFNECLAWPELCSYGSCKKLMTGYQCECPHGFFLNSRGTNCTDINECQLNPLTCGPGRCINSPGSFDCDCQPGYESHTIMKVCMDVDECANDVMLCRGGSCINTDGSFRCDCPEGHELMPGGKACKDIDECSTGSAVCSNGRCENFMGGYQCTCDKGFKPNDIHTACLDVDECTLSNNKCEEGCQNTLGSFSCTCQNGFKLSPNGFSCVDINECLNDANICGGGACENEQGGYRCICVDGYQLSVDQITCADINECTVDPNICGVGDCENTVGSYNCDCDPGFSKKPLDAGCTDIDECKGENLCHKDADCENLSGSYQCSCKSGYTGDGIDCRDVNECLVNNGGCDPDASCINTAGSYICLCDDGFHGTGDECFDFDECSVNLDLCKNGQCLNDPGSYHCECDMGFASTQDGQDCEDINECEEFEGLCMNGICENIDGMFQCICNQGYELDETRSNCTDINECDSEGSCDYGECVNQEGGYQCNCPPGYDLVASGNACIDRRQGSCYMQAPKVGEGVCSFSFSQRVSRARCCCSVGAGWGQNPGSCEACPVKGTELYEELCPGGLVVVEVDGQIELADDDECELLPSLCKGGTCQNTFGSFQCTCPAGYLIDEMYICQDIDECEEYPGICGIGSCMNTVGDYTCDCPDGHLLMPDKNCMDMRKSTCFPRVYNSSQPPYDSICENPLAMHLTRKLCCCSVGQGWLDPDLTDHDDQTCDACPVSKTDEHENLCGLKPGYVFNKDINECLVIPNLCLNGECINTDGSYICECNEGYRYDSKLLYCVDEDECKYSPCHQTAICQNQPGSFLCTCPEGFLINSLDFSCSDINECEDSSVCDHGSCRNTDGGFECQCNSGFRLSVNKQKCLDMDECDLQADMCGSGMCTNMMGSYKCECFDGFHIGPSGRCQDINECRTLQGICSYGRCKNTQGDFTCECQNGYQLSADGHNCIDVDECTELSNMCIGGECMNFDGYYKCVCPNGYNLSTTGTICLDINECEEEEDACLFGQCVNERGSYYCRCPDDFIQSYDGSVFKCMDTRVGLCFDEMADGTCTGEMPVVLGKSSCCCALGLPAGWSYDGVCEACPHANSSAFKDLCHMGVGYVELPDGSIIDIDECLMHPDNCQNGQCINMDGGYRCECNRGYELDETSSLCIDTDECAATTNVCGQGSCRNMIGDFMCNCYDGFQPGPDGKCQDIDECEDYNLHQCAFRCHNMFGSFVCVCPAGYELSEDGRHCIDVDECLTPTHNCKHACKNLIGSFICICSEGYQKASLYGDDCEDVNECQQNPNICNNGRCINFNGGYRCECPPDSTLSPTGQSCINTRKDLCYYQLDYSGSCPSNTSSLQSSTMFSCCCSRALAWGQSCTRCPSVGTAEHKKLCIFGPGFEVTGQDINECLLMRNACPNGRCLNTMGSYRCVCSEGYKVGESGKDCVDINECQLNPNLCEYKCVNTIGSFSCECEEGYNLSYDKRSCHDIDECSLGTYRCDHNATCVNSQGGYRCQCPQGYQARQSRCVDINECSRRGICGTAECVNTVGGYHCSCARRGGTFNPETLVCDSGQTTGTGGKGNSNNNNNNRTTGIRNSCRDDECLFACQSFGNAYYCGCPLGYQLVDQGHCIATISHPDEKYFDNKLPLPHVPGKQGNNLPLGEGCWLCGISSVEKAQLVEMVSRFPQSHHRSKRDAGSLPDYSQVESMLLEPIVVNLNPLMTKVKERNTIITLIQSRKYTSDETYKLFGNDNHKFLLNKLENEVTLTFQHKVMKQRTYRLILLIANNASMQISLLPIEINIQP